MRIRQRTGNVSIDISTDRIDRNARDAQRALNEQVVADCTPLVPFQQGALRGTVDYPKGIYGGEISWGGEAVDVPYAHYIYTEVLYKGSHPIKDSDGNVIGWWSEPHKTPTNKPLRYHTPGTTGKWFEVSKRRNLQSWIRLVRETAGRG